jgi:hypothetical protein
MKNIRYRTPAVKVHVEVMVRVDYFHGERESLCILYDIFGYSQDSLVAADRTLCISIEQLVHIHSS